MLLAQKQNIQQMPAHGPQQRCALHSERIRFVLRLLQGTGKQNAHAQQHLKRFCIVQRHSLLGPAAINVQWVEGQGACVAAQVRLHALKHRQRHLVKQAAQLIKGTSHHARPRKHQRCLQPLGHGLEDWDVNSADRDVLPQDNRSISQLQRVFKLRHVIQLFIANFIIIIATRPFSASLHTLKACICSFAQACICSFALACACAFVLAPPFLAFALACALTPVTAVHCSGVQRGIAVLFGPPPQPKRSALEQRDWR